MGAHDFWFFLLASPRPIEFLILGAGGGGGFCGNGGGGGSAKFIFMVVGTLLKFAKELLCTTYKVSGPSGRERQKSPNLKGSPNHVASASEDSQSDKRPPWSLKESKRSLQVSFFSGLWGRLFLELKRLPNSPYWQLGRGGITAQAAL